MSLLLTSPAFLLGLAVVGRFGRSRLVTGSVLAVVLVALLDLMHFSQGWVQFGYRFSNDAVPFALLLVALGIDHLTTRDTTAGAARGRWARAALPLAMGLIVASMAINLWGVIWSRLLGW
jgi:uncharacterized membrane protein